MKLWLSLVNDERGTVIRAKSLDIGDPFAGKTLEEVQEIADSLAHWVHDRTKAQPWGSNDGKA